jgi:hypothetical protein
MKKNIENISKYAFVRIDEEGVKITLSDCLNEFKTFNHYGFNPGAKDLDDLKRHGVIGWTGNDVWYYIMQHDTWRYMNFDLRIKTGRAIIKKEDAVIQL